MKIYSSPSYQMGQTDELDVPVTQGEVMKAKQELARMKRSLKGWLKKRARNKRLGVPYQLAIEGPLAEQLHALLSEVYPSQLPKKASAVELAKIAILGLPPQEASAQEAMGIWPLVVLVGAAAFVISTAIRNQADIAKHKLDIECQMSGKCTDTGFWLKLGAIAVVGWLAWDKLGLKQKFGGTRRRRR
jgi:hypothetical protein